MKKLLLATAVLAVLAAGCVKLNLDTTIQNTGAGTFDVTFAFAPGVLDALKDLASSPGAAGGNKIPDLGVLDRDRLEAACRQAGVTLTGYERRQVEGREQTHVTMGFKRIEDLRNVLEPAGDPQGSLGLYKLPNGDYTIRASVDEGGGAGSAAAEGSAPTPAGAPGGAGSATGASAGAGAAPAPGNASPDLKTPEQVQAQNEAAQKSMAAVGKLLATASELDIVLRITVPGEVISHNAMRAEGRTLIWQINAENMLTAANGVPEIVFSGKGLNIDAPLWKGPARAAMPAAPTAATGSGR